MDPVQDQPGPNARPVPPPVARSDASASLHSLPGTARPPSRNSSQQLPPSTDIVLRISPASGSATFGFILVSENERHLQDAIAAYFDSAGRDITVLPCPNFSTFLIEHSLQERNVSLVSDLPRYIIPAGTRILQANQFDASPVQDWLPAPPDLSSFNAASRSSSTRFSSRSLLTRRDAHSSRRPDPEGDDGPSYHARLSTLHHPTHRVPVQTVVVGSSHGSYGGFSPLTYHGSGSLGGGVRSRMGGGLTAGNMGGGLVAGGAAPAYPALETFPLSSHSGTPAPAFAPLAQPDVTSSATSILEDSLSDPPAPTPTASSVVIIKDKASDLGLKDIVDKQSWIDAKKFIDARLRRPPFYPGPDSTALITTTANKVASSWWEEVINYYVKPPISDLFVEESRFDGKGFEMIKHIDKYFNPSGAVDSLGHIFDLIDITQAQDESVITLRARFLRIFASLKMGGVAIESALQVGFMLRSLLSRYHGVVHDFRLGRHSLTDATLQSVVEQCMAYDKDPWKGPVGKDEKSLRHPSANVAGAGGEPSGNPYDAMAKCSFNLHMSRWRKGCVEGSERCMICHNTSNKPPHHSAHCPILNKLGLKLVKRTPADGDAASRVGNVRSAPVPPVSAAAPAPMPSSTVGGSGGSTSTPGAFTAATDLETYDSGDEYDYEGKYEGKVFSTVDNKPKSNISLYSRASHATAKDQASSFTSSTAIVPSCRRSTSVDPKGVKTIQLPKLVLALLANPPAHSTRFFTSLKSRPNSSLLVADTGATDHMLPHKSAFISYKPTTGRRVRMGNNSFAPILGTGSAIISINGKLVLIRDCLHVPALRNPLYSLRAHQRQHGCGHIGMDGLGMFVFFPTFVVEVDTDTDCHLSYKPIGRSASLARLDYVQPIRSPSQSASATMTTAPPAPAMIEDDSDCDDIMPPLPSHSPVTPTPDAPLPDADPPSPAILNACSSPKELECMSVDEIRSCLHHPSTHFPAIRPCDTPNASDSKSTFTPEDLHRLTGCRRFRNYQHIISTSKDGVLCNTGEFPLSLGAYTTIPKAARGKPVDRLPSKYLDIVHLDIAFGDCVSVGGYKFALLFVDRATRYNWSFGLKSLQHSDIQAAFLAFRAEAGAFARQFCCDCNEKLFGSAVRSFLHTHNSSIAASPAGRQSSNGLVESHWKIMVHMSRAYLTEKQMPRTFWYYAVKHAARMMNMIPGKYRGKLASPFMLVHGARPDPRTWLPLFLLCYFHHEKDSDASRSKSQAHTMDGIILGRSPTSNAILVYNPRNQRYYEPDSYRIDPYRLPSSVYPSIQYDGGLFVSLHRNDIPNISEPYPPGTRVLDSNPATGLAHAGTVMDIPFDSTTSPHYLILLDDGTTRSVPAADMASLIPKPTIDATTTDHLLPPFLQLGSKITFEKDGQYHKGFLGQLSDGVYRFSFKSHINKKTEDWGIPLPNLPTTWQDLCLEGILIPGHHSSFLRPPLPTNATARHVSATSLKRECPRSLLSGLHPTHPDRKTWLASFREEKSGIQSQDTYDKLTLAEYRSLRAKGAPRAIPTMCVLTIKKDEMLNPLRAKSRIVALGNHEDRVWSKPEKYAPVLRPDTLRLLVSMAVEHRRTLKQGDCKNAFCQGILPADEITIVKPPIGDPDAEKDEYWLLKRTLYGLRRSPRHWYNKITGILHNLGLKPNASDPCLFTGNLIDPSNPAIAPSTVHITLGIYVDDFVYFSTDPAVERQFEQLLAKYVTVDFMGTVEWFLGTHFQWSSAPDNVSVHMNQTGFAAHLVEANNVHTRNITPDATPYRSGLPIDAIPESDEPDDCPALIERKRHYQSVVGSIGWLAQTTRPDLLPTHSFLSAYNNKPSKSHWNAALYALHYIHSTIDYGIMFMSAECGPLHTCMSFPASSDTEAYTDAIPPSTAQHHRLTTYSDACWGSQLGNAVREGVQLPLFKFRSMSGAIVMRSGGPIAWKGDRQERTALSSCEAEIRATNMGARLTVNTRNMISSLADLGYPIDDTSIPTPLYNDNKACVKWCHNMTTKGNRHIENRENSTREWVADGTITVTHVAGKCNVSDIFTKEMRDAANFRRLRDSFMCRASDYLKGIHHLASDASPVLAQSTQNVPPDCPGIIDVLASFPSLRTSSMLSNISAAGRHILSQLAPPSYLQVLMRDPMGGVST